MYKGNNRGVSETIGFVIILGIVITGIGIVTLYGYPMLLEQQQNANVRNMEKNMIVLQSEQNLLTYKGVPFRETSMQVSGGALSIVNPNPSPPNPLGPGSSHFIVDVHTYNTTNPGYESNASLYKLVTPGLLEYSSSSANEIIALQNGAVVTTGFSETGGSTMLSEPRWFVDRTGNKKTLVITLITVQSPSAISSEGIGTVQMNITQEETVDYEIPAGTTNKPYVDIHYLFLPDGYKNAWKNYLSNQQVFGTDSLFFDNGSDIYVEIFGLDRIVIKKFTITVLNL